ncbi:MAG: hypothetical protein GY679_01395 [Mycoplasma sp.]|nr:hypothetical protein [Mycoplasma sp.]
MIEHKILKNKREFSRWINDIEGFVKDADSVIDPESFDYQPETDKAPDKYPVVVAWKASISPPYEIKDKIRHRLMLDFTFIDG